MTSTNASIEKFRQASREYSDASIMMHEAIAAKAGLSGTDHKYLGLIMKGGAMTAGEIARVTGLTTGAVTGLVDRLEKKQLVRRQANRNDRRKVVVIPNEKKVMELLEPIFADLQQQTEKLILRFSEQEIQAVESYFTAATELMKTITQNLRQ